MKKFLDVLKTANSAICDKADYIVAGFYNKLTVLFLLGFVCILMIVGSIVFWPLVWMSLSWWWAFPASLFGIILTPIGFLYGFYGFSSVQWHFWETFFARLSAIIYDEKSER
jgi:nucleoside permease NupC